MPRDIPPPLRILKLPVADPITGHSDLENLSRLRIHKHFLGLRSAAKSVFQLFLCHEL
jgi:hypothetical protein